MKLYWRTIALRLLTGIAVGILAGFVFANSANQPGDRQVNPASLLHHYAGRG